MNIESGDARLVLLCPAWKRWATATTVKENTVILHSRADETIQFAESKELASGSGATLIEIGSDHRLADPEPLSAMLKASEAASGQSRKYRRSSNMASNRILQLCAEHVGGGKEITSISFDNRNYTQAVILEFADGESAIHPILETEREKYVEWWKQSLKLLRKGLIEALKIGPNDAVVEFAPGLGDTARLTLQQNPATYTAVERDKDAAALVQQYLQRPNRNCVVGLAENTGLPDASASVVYGEAMLSMQTPQQKQAIVKEAFRLLKSGGRYGIHELCLIPDDLGEDTKQTIHSELAAAIHHGTRPLTVSEWTSLLVAEGFSIQAQAQAPMHLLEPRRMIQDEGLLGACRFAVNMLCNREARQRVLAMRRVFAKHRDHLAAIMLTGIK